MLIEHRHLPLRFDLNVDRSGIVPLSRRDDPIHLDCTPRGDLKRGIVSRKRGGDNGDCHQKIKGELDHARVSFHSAFLWHGLWMTEIELALSAGRSLVEHLRPRETIFSENPLYLR